MLKPSFETKSASERAEVLLQVAGAIESIRAEIVPVAMEETHLPEARLNGECDRTIFQWKNFAEDLEAGRWEPEVSGKYERKWVPIGPVAVFGASNFPLAFSVAGGDTASAIAAGCPVVVKAHPAHPRTSDLMAGALAQVLAPPEFQCVHLSNEEAGNLVQSPWIKGVGFTGSQAVGRHLMNLAAARPDPIPVYAEMGSTNPIVVLPGGFESFQAGYLNSLTLGVGQFCTNPGIVFGIDSPEWRALIHSMKSTFQGTMLNTHIAETYCQGIEMIRAVPELTWIQEPIGPGSLGIAECSSATFRKDPALHQEIFGPFGLFVTCQSLEDLLHSLEDEGQLTASLHFGPAEQGEAREVQQRLESFAGRIILNGFPTGVEVCDLMQHGGPYPASSHAHFTSVGNRAILRWLRPVCIQNG